MKIHIEVTQEDIDMAGFEYNLNDGPRWGECCPIAQALHRQLGDREWFVDPGCGVRWEFDQLPVPLPMRARLFGRRWDRVYSVPDNWPKPFAFDLDLPDEVAAMNPQPKEREPGSGVAG